MAFAVLLIVAGMVVPAEASSAASRNKDGNRLYTQGRYQDAEKAYLDAQLAAPGKPELLYNMGNALLKQKKHQDALQALRQAISRGSQGLQGNGWYNLGNALFEMGNYKEAADSFIQSLRVNPADRDAKQNLELALKKLQEQKKSTPDNGKDQQQQQQKKEQQQQQQSASNSENDKKQENRQQQMAPPEQKKDEQPAGAQASQARRREEGLSKDQALQILDALQNQELSEQRKLLERQARRKAVGKDW